MNIQNSDKGAALYLSLMIMTVLLAIALGLGAIFISQVKVMRGLGNSVIAFHAANTGIERVLAGDRRNPQPVSGSFLLNDNKASYEVTVIAGGTKGCPAPHFCIRSTGTYQETRRAIEIAY